MAGSENKNRIKILSDYFQQSFQLEWRRRRKNRKKKVLTYAKNVLTIIKNRCGDEVEPHICEKFEKKTNNQKKASTNNISFITLRFSTTSSQLTSHLSFLRIPRKNKMWDPKTNPSDLLNHIFCAFLHFMYANLVWHCFHKIWFSFFFFIFPAFD